MKRFRFYRGWGLFLLLLVVLVATLVMVTCLLVNSALRPSETSVEDTSGEETEVVVEPEVEPEITKIDFQPTVDAWAQNVSGNRSVLIYDLDRREMVGEYNSEEDYNTASLYKLFVVYEGYRRLQSGVWNGDDTVGVTGRTIRQCLDLAIRESNSPCAESLLSMIGRDTLREIIAQDFGVVDSDVLSLVAKPGDILKIMQIFYEHREITDEGLVAQMKDSFLNQPVTTYDWRQGLPSGFTKANVYNKVGWDYNPNGGYWNVYNDAAIVEFLEANRHFVVVVMTNKVPFQLIRQLGFNIEATFDAATAAE